MHKKIWLDLISWTEIVTEKRTQNMNLHIQIDSHYIVKISKMFYLIYNGFTY